MSDRKGSNSNMQNNQVNMTEDVIRGFEMVLGNMGDRLDWLDASVTELYRGQPNARRQGK